MFSLLIRNTHSIFFFTSFKFHLYSEIGPKRIDRNLKEMSTEVSEIWNTWNTHHVHGGKNPFSRFRIRQVFVLAWVEVIRLWEKEVVKTKTKPYILGGVALDWFWAFVCFQIFSSVVKSVGNYFSTVESLFAIKKIFAFAYTRNLQIQIISF